MAAEEDAISCSVCKGIYRDPRSLLCGHSFCLKCIKGISDRRQMFPCPMCRFSVDIRYEKVDQLPKNFVLCSVIEAKHKTQLSMCLKHKKLLDIFCERCDVVMCSKCLTMQHKGHVIEDVDKIFIERNEKLEAFLATTKLLASKIQEKRDVVKQSRNSTEKNADTIHNTVDNIFKKWYDALDKQQNTILSYLHQERNKKIQVFDETESVLMSSMTNVTELETEINKLMSKDTVFVVQQYGSVKARQEDTERKVLQDIKTSCTPPDDLNIEICAPWIEEAIDNIKPTDMMQTKAKPRTQKIYEIQSENIILKRKYDGLLHETEVFQTTVNEISRTLLIKKQKSSPLQDKMQQISNKIQSLMSDLKSANTMNKQLQNDHETLQNTNDRMKKKNKMLEKSVQDKDQCLSQEKQIVSDLQKKAQAMEKEEKEKIKKLMKTIEEHKHYNIYFIVILILICIYVCVLYIQQ